MNNMITISKIKIHKEINEFISQNNNIFSQNMSSPKTSSRFFIQHLKDGVKDAGFPAAEKCGEGVSSRPPGERVGEELAHFLDEGRGSHLKVVSEVALGRQRRVLMGQHYGKGWHFGQVTVST